MFAHIDADAFFASVLVRKDPRLKGKPLLALGMGGGCVIAASYEAKARGVKTGMRRMEAKTLCPEAVERVSDFAESCRASQQIEEIFRNDCPHVERASVDEWFLDLPSLQGGMPANPGAWAQMMQKTVVTRTGLSVSIGVAATKTLAKMASEYRKPAGITILASQERGMRRHSSFSILHSQFLKDRPAAAIPGIGRKRVHETERQGWHTAWDFACAPRSAVKHFFGKTGEELLDELMGTSVYAMEVCGRPPKSVSRCRSFRAISNREQAFTYMVEHVRVTVGKMRRQHLACRWISVWLRDGTYRSNEAHCALPRCMDTEEEILPYVRTCFRTVWKDGIRATQAGLGLYGLSPNDGLQSCLFDPPDRLRKREDMQRAIDRIEERFGRGAIVSGAGIPTTAKRKTRKMLYGDIAS